MLILGGLRYVNRIIDSNTYIYILQFVVAYDVSLQSAVISVWMTLHTLCFYQCIVVNIMKTDSAFCHVLLHQSFTDLVMVFVTQFQ